MIKKSMLSIALALGISGFAHADQNIAVLKEKILQAMPGLTIDALKESAIPGVYELVSAGDVAYVSKDGEHMIQGNLFNVPNKKNLTEQTLAGIRKTHLNELDDASLIVYPAKGQSLYTITVFTDPSCPYCHRMHDEMQKYNEAGITVRYALYARMGGNTNTSRQIEEIVCAAKPKDAADIFFKNSNRISEGAKCDKTQALSKITSLAPKLGLEGTPHIVMSNGMAFSGYQPVSELLKTLQNNS